MVRALSQQCNMHKSLSFNLKKMFDVQGGHSLSCVWEKNIVYDKNNIDIDSGHAGDNSPQDNMNMKISRGLKQDKPPVSCFHAAGTRTGTGFPVVKPHSGKELGYILLFACAFVKCDFCLKWCFQYARNGLFEPTFKKLFFLFCSKVSFTIGNTFTWSRKHK